MNIEKEMFHKALNFLNERYGENKAGGVAVLRIETGEYLTSVWDEERNSSAYLCIKKLLIHYAYVDRKIINHMKYYHHVEYVKKDYITGEKM